MVARFLLVPLLVVVLVSLAETSARAAEGWYIEIRHTDGRESGSAELRMEGDRIRAGEAGMLQEVILGTEGLTVLDHADESYMVITYKQIQTILGPFMRAMKEMSESQKQALEGAIEGLTPEERAEVEAQLGSLDGGEDSPVIQIKAVHETETIAGLSASKIVVSRDGQPVVEAWVTEKIPLDPFTRALNRLAPILGVLGGEGPAKYWNMLEELPGFPLKVVDLSGKEPAEILRVTEAAKQKFTDADFTVPPGFKNKVRNWGFGGGG